jgi:hypothetical protein
VALLEAVPGKAIDQIKAVQLWPFAQNGVAVKGVDGVQAGPAIG